jgi:ABC-type polysaccharide/polyol phosphate export permease
VFKELIAALKSSDSWLYMGVKDILIKYKRTVLGPFWIVLMSAISILSMTLVGAVVFKIGFRDFAPHVASGIIIWGYLSSLILESCIIFIQNGWLIQNIKTNFVSLVLRMFVRNTLIFLHGFVILLGVFLYFGYNFNLIIVISIAFGLLLYGLNTLGLAFFFGLIGARYRDFSLMMQSLMSILIFTVPIWWKPEMLGDKSYLLDFNPLFHFLNLLRMPLINGSSADFRTYVYTISITVIVILTGALFFKKYKKNVVFWL